MSKVELFEEIRVARRKEKLSHRDLAARFEVHRRVVVLALASQVPPARKRSGGFVIVAVWWWGAGWRVVRDPNPGEFVTRLLKTNGPTDTDVMTLFCKAHRWHIHLNDLVVKRNLVGSISITERRTGAVVAYSNSKRAA